jgi:hypothetical protein
MDSDNTRMPRDSAAGYRRPNVISVIVRASPRNREMSAKRDKALLFNNLSDVTGRSHHTPAGRPVKSPKTPGIAFPFVPFQTPAKLFLEIIVEALFPPERMKPLRDRAQAGRANPKGIPRPIRVLHTAGQRNGAGGNEPPARKRPVGVVFIGPTKPWEPPTGR